MGAFDEIKADGMKSVAMLGGWVWEYCLNASVLNVKSIYLIKDVVMYRYATLAENTRHTLSC